MSATTEWLEIPEGIWEEDIQEGVVQAVHPLQIADHNWNHLWLPFRERQESLFKECENHGLKMVMFEGYRSPDRQLWLYGQGRPRFNPYGREGDIVTGLKTPKRHGGGTASDDYPDNGRGRPIFAFTSSELKLWKSLQKKFGVEPTAFPGDYGHIQMICSYREQEEARKWAENGFPVLPPKRTPVKVVYNNKVIYGVNAYVQEGTSYGILRPVASAIGLKHGFPVGGFIQVWDPGYPEKIEKFKCSVDQYNRTWVALRDFSRFGFKVNPELNDKIIRIVKNG